jgi:hypothetical protein
MRTHKGGDVLGGQSNVTDDHGEVVATNGSPAGPLDTLQDDRSRIDRILDRLDVTDDLPERADLASELVRAASRHEHVVENAVVPSVEGDLDAGALERLTTQRDDLRDAMDYIHKRTQHLAPRNAHAGDPQGLEDATADVIGRLRALLADEDATVAPLVDGLDPQGKQELDAAVKKSSRHAAERPKPARTAIGRVASNIATKMDHTVQDMSTPDHPGADTIEG